MPRYHRPTTLSEQVEGEIITLYTDSNAPVTEIKNTYNLTNGHLYSILRRHGILRRTKDQRTTAQDIPTLPAPADLSVTADKNGIVESVQRVPSAAFRKLYVWEIRYESQMRVEAETIQEAIVQVQRIPTCRRVFHVSLKGAS